MGKEWKIVIGVSTRALFDLRKENEIFQKEGRKAYCEYQQVHEEEVLEPGPGFRLIQALLGINQLPGQENGVEVVILSHNSPEVSLRVFHSIEYYGLPIRRAVFASGASIAPYLSAFHVDLFLSACEADVQAAIDSGIAAGVICQEWDEGAAQKQGDEIRIAFDGDAVLFSDEAEQIFKEKGLEAFEESERSRACCPLPEGPFARLLKKFSRMRRECGEEIPIRIALVTARSAPAHERVIRTLREWKVWVDEAFFLGGISKKEFLRAFGAHMFFDDQQVHTNLAAQAVPAARVPYQRERQNYLYRIYEKEQREKNSGSGKESTDFPEQGTDQTPVIRTGRTAVPDCTALAKMV